jgi:hypothetical protein
MEKNDISVIIQGPVYDKITDKTVANVREMFPASEVIVSTWEGANYKNALADLVIESKDPGGYPVYDNPLVFHAANRQIVSTAAGLKKAAGKYALKIRSDMYFEHTGFLEYWGRFEKRSAKYKFLQERILLSTAFAPNPRREPKPYHPSDWFFFGLTSDLADVFDIPLCPEPDTSRYFETHKRPTVKNDGWIPALCQYPSEQYIWVAFLRKYTEFDFDHCFDIGKGNVEKSEHIFANNAVLIDAANIRYDSYKHGDLHTKYDLAYMYSHFEWLSLYKKYCDSAFVLPLLDREKIRRIFVALKTERSRRILRNVKALLCPDFESRPLY